MSIIEKYSGAIKNKDESDKSITLVRSKDAPTIANEQKINL